MFSDGNKKAENPEMEKFLNETTRHKEKNILSFPITVFY